MKMYELVMKSFLIFYFLFFAEGAVLRDNLLGFLCTLSFVLNVTWTPHRELSSRRNYFLSVFLFLFLSFSLSLLDAIPILTKIPSKLT
jgi:hypothetical protein